MQYPESAKMQHGICKDEAHAQLFYLYDLQCFHNMGRLNKSGCIKVFRASGLISKSNMGQRAGGGIPCMIAGS